MNIIDELKAEKESIVKLGEYVSLVSKPNEFYERDFKNNYKFIWKAFVKMRKDKISNIEILKFTQDAIDIHKKNYC